jgi:hypothetical protein
MRNELHPLPICIPPEPGESGKSFFMRTAKANGTTLSSLLSWLDLVSLEMASDEGLSTLAFIAGVHGDWLRRHVVRTRREDANRVLHAFGFEWSWRPCLRTSDPQICPHCLAEREYCDFTWDVRGIYACPRHACLLVDCCSRCQKRICWNRPSVDVCACGSYLSGQKDGPLTLMDMHWCQALTSAMQGKSSEANSFDIPEWLMGLSPEGMFCIVYAAGVRDRPHCHVPQGGRSLDVRTTREIVRRGLARISAVRVDEVFPEEDRALFYEEGLIRTETKAASGIDRKAARDLLDWMRRPVVEGKGKSGRRSQGQLSLFGESYV